MDHDGEAQPHAHALAEGAQGVIENRAEVGVLGDGLDDLGRRTNPGGEGERDRGVVAGGQHRVEPGVGIEQGTDATGDLDRPLVGSGHAGEQAQQGGLFRHRCARTMPVASLPTHREVDVAERPELRRSQRTHLGAGGSGSARMAPTPYRWALRWSRAYRLPSPSTTRTVSSARSSGSHRARRSDGHDATGVGPWSTTTVAQRLLRRLPSSSARAIAGSVPPNHRLQ